MAFNNMKCRLTNVMIALLNHIPTVIDRLEGIDNKDALVRFLARTGKTFNEVEKEFKVHLDYFNKEIRNGS